MKRTVTVMCMLSLCGHVLVSAAKEGSQEQDDQQPIHPEVFEMVTCWLSDTMQPVVTEINLDAVNKNRNQFSYGNVFREGDWITIDRTEKGGRLAFLRYRVVASSEDVKTVLLQSNGGGSLTTQTQIGFTIQNRTIELDGKNRSVRVLRVVSVQ